MLLLDELFVPVDSSHRNLAPTTSRPSACFSPTRFLVVIIAIAMGAVPLTRPALADETFHPDVVVGLLELILEVDPDSARGTLQTLRAKIQNRELDAQRVDELRPKLEPLLSPIRRQGITHPLYPEVMLLAAAWGEPEARDLLSSLVNSDKIAEESRAEALRLWLDSFDRQPPDKPLQHVRRLLDSSETTLEFKRRLLQAMGQTRHGEVASLLLESHARLDPSLRPQIIELLTRRAAWSKRLLQEIEQKRLPSTVLNVNQVARLQSSPDDELVELSRRVWGIVRTDRNPDRQRVIQEVRELIDNVAGNPFRGRDVFRKVCANCHVIHGEGHDVGPDVTRNGRSSFEQLLSNVLDPSLVIGASYQGRIVVTEDGQVFTGLVIEENDQRVVLKLPGGQRETIRQKDIEVMRVSELSLMPEALEQQLESQELADLFAFLQLDKPPDDPTAQRIPRE